MEGERLWLELFELRGIVHDHSVLEITSVNDKIAVFISCGEGVGNGLR